MKARLLAALCVALIVAVVFIGQLWRSGPSPEADAQDPPASDIPYLRAAHWFGDAWPINFWRTDLEAVAEADFAKLREDGFNAVVLLVPWPGFAPDARSGELDDVLVERLRNLMRQARSSGLDTILRISYAYEALDDEHGWRGYHLWLNDAYYQGWLDHIEALWQAIGTEPGLKFGFFSWEDLWGVMYHIGRRTRDERVHAARTSGFRQWLAERHRLDEVAARFGHPIESWETLAIPTEREAGFAVWLEYLDYAWIQRFFLPARQRFPKLSMEIRIDADPVYTGDELLDWHHHHAAWDLPGADWVTLYWSPAMGGSNEGEVIAPQLAAERLQWWLEQVAEQIGPRQIFIGQFLAEDFTPGFEHNGRIPREQVPEFLDLAAGILARTTGGYGLWTWQDYGHNAIANPEFRAGLAAWQASADVAITDHGAQLPSGAWLASRVFTPQTHAPDHLDGAELCVTGHAASASTSRLEIRDRQRDTHLAEIELGPEQQTRCTEIRAMEAIDLTLHAHGDSLIRRVELIDFIQKSGMRDRHGNLKPAGQAYRKLNRALTHQPLIEQPLHHDGWMGRHLVVHLDPPPATPILHLATHLPENWPVQPELTLSVDGTIVATTPCTADGSIHLPVAIAQDRQHPVRIRIETTTIHIPPEDHRQLGCLIRQLNWNP